MQQTGTVNKWNHRDLRLKALLAFSVGAFTMKCSTITKTFFCHETHESRLDPLFDRSRNIFRKHSPISWEGPNLQNSKGYPGEVFSTVRLNFPTQIMIPAFGWAKFFRTKEVFFRKKKKFFYDVFRLYETKAFDTKMVTLIYGSSKFSRRAVGSTDSKLCSSCYLFAPAIK